MCHFLFFLLNFFTRKGSLLRMRAYTFSLSLYADVGRLVCDGVRLRCCGELLFLRLLDACLRRF